MLEVKNLTAGYNGKIAVENICFSVNKGEVVGLVGESGSGKSTVALSIMRLIKEVSGEILLDGHDLLKLSEEEMRHVRGARISIIFQDPFSSLNPVFTVGDQVAEALRLHQGLNKKDAWKKAIEMLDLVQINGPAERIADYPHQFSGGMRQRVMIAMALACRPEILIADEPTTALDVTIQAEILKLLKELKDKLNLSIIFITHNFGIVKRICDRVVVMQAGKMIEEGRAADILANPQQSYTKELIDCLNKINSPPNPLS